METRFITLPKGGNLEVVIHPGFYDAVRKQFMLLPEQEVTDDHIRMFIFGAVDNAVKKVEG